MKEYTIGDGYGFANMRIGNAPPVPLDLWEAHNVYSQLGAAAGNDDVAFVASWLDWLAGKGLVELSHGAGIQVFKHIKDAIAELEKKEPDSAKPG